MLAKDKIPDPLYFIALLLPDHIASTITDIKEDMAENFHSKAAFRSPPHVTLHMPFRYPEKKTEKLFLFLEEFARMQSPLEIKIKDFGAFPPRVIFAGVEPNEELDLLQGDLLKAIRKDLLVFNGNYKERGYHPHITVAFRDLKPRFFKLAWEVYQHKTLTFNFSATFISLLKHNGQQWEVLKRFKLAR